MAAIRSIESLNARFGRAVVPVLLRHWERRSRLGSARGTIWPSSSGGSIPRNGTSTTPRSIGRQRPSTTLTNDRLEVISDPLRNRGVAFDRQHRRRLGLAGWLLALVAVVVLLSVSGAGRRAP